MEKKNRDERIKYHIKIRIVILRKNYWIKRAVVMRVCWVGCLMQCNMHKQAQNYLQCFERNSQPNCKDVMLWWPFIRFKNLAWDTVTTIYTLEFFLHSHFQSQAPMSMNINHLIRHQQPTKINTYLDNMFFDEPQK